MRMKWLNLNSWSGASLVSNQHLLWLTLLRLSIAVILLLLLLLWDQHSWFSAQNQLLLLKIAFAYLLFGIGIFVINSLTNLQSILKLPMQIALDIGFILLLIHASGGSQSGFGIILIVVIVTASLLSDGRYALFYAALATIGLLIEHSVRILLFDYNISSYTQPVLLSLACFATAWLAHDLGKRMQQSEATVSQQQSDLANLAQINSLISRESQDGIIVMDEHQVILHSNLAAKRYLGISDSNANQPILLQNIAPLAGLFARWQAEPDALLMLDLHTYSLKVQFLPMQTDESNTQSGTIVFIQDMSQQKTQSQQAKLAALGTLTAKIAHEIRNPLSSISHANQLLQEDIVASDHTRLLMIIEDNILRIDQIIKDVLELNRRDRTQSKQFSLTKFATEFHHQFCAVENIPAEHFVLNLPENTCQIQFDHRHLTQILWNLCKNGLEHGKKQQNSLKLSLQTDVMDLVKLCVIDDGEGIPPEHQQQLFEPFFTTKDSGSGLGLYISRELAEANGGLLRYESRPVGSAFILEIKLKQP